MTLQRPEDYNADIDLELDGDRFQIERVTGKAAEADYEAFIAPLDNLNEIIGKCIPVAEVCVVRTRINALRNRNGECNISMDVVEEELAGIAPEYMGYNVYEATVNYLNSPISKKEEI
jgi:Zn-dependent oligopeptidase